MSALNDLTGQKFGRLTVIRREGSSRSGKATWLCRCECGNTTVVIGSCLINGNTSSCGCYQREVASIANYIDLTGQKFGRLTVKKKQKSDENNNVIWECECDCGNLCTVSTSSLRNGSKRSCGCLAIEVSKAREVDITGMKFGRWTALYRVEDVNSVNPMWVCRCECGTQKEIDKSSLIDGRSKSCGCLRQEIVKDLHTKHDGCNDRLYGVWKDMKSRCYNKNIRSYKDYGGRGIKICESWKNDYAEFKKWAYENGYDENAQKGDCTIDRIDVNGDYCPENCRFVDSKLQAQNKRKRTSS